MKTMYTQVIGSELYISKQISLSLDDYKVTFTYVIAD